jgi:predicted nucleic acid-binding protein
MIARFADTFFYLALINKGDSAHSQAVELARRLTGNVVTSAWILTEVGDALADPSQRQNFIKLIERDSRFEIRD